MCTGVVFVPFLFLAGMVRRDVVCQLRAVAREWDSALNSKNKGKLRKLIERLQRFAPSPAEIKWSGIGRVTRIEKASPILKGPDLAILKTLREKWTRDYESLPKHARKLAEPTGEDEDFLTAVAELKDWLHRFSQEQKEVSELVAIATVLVSSGFSHWRDLDSAGPDLVKGRDGIDDAAVALVNRAVEWATLKGTEPREGSTLRACDTAADSVADAILTADREFKALPGPNARPWPSGIGAAFGPRQSCTALAAAVHSGMAPCGILQQARIDNVLESASKSLPSIASAVQCWAGFCDGVLQAGGHHLPPSPEGLAAWARCFRNSKVYGNYVAGVRFACELVGLPTDATYHPAV